MKDLSSIQLLNYVKGFIEGSHHEVEKFLYDNNADYDTAKAFREIMNTIYWYEKTN